MLDFIIKQPYDLTSNAGLALAGQFLKRLQLDQSFDEWYSIGAAGIANSDFLKSYLDLQVQGKNDFESIEAYQGDALFRRALGVKLGSSSSTLRQRLDACANSCLKSPARSIRVCFLVVMASKPLTFAPWSLAT
jgi:hypothetical protein